MRTLPAAEVARIQDGSGTWEFWVEIERATDPGWIELTDVDGRDYVLAISLGNESPDEPVGRFAVRFLLKDSGEAVSPGDAASPLNQDSGGAYDPLLYSGNRIRIDAANLAEGETRATATRRRWLEGEIEDVDWPGDEVACDCTTLDGRLFAAMIEAKEVRGSVDPGTPVEEEIPALAERWMEDPPELYVPVDPDFNVGEYTPQDNVGAQGLLLAQQRGFDLRHRWSDVLGRYAWTLYLPPRDKTVPDLTIDPEEIEEVPGLKVSRRYVRNAFTWEYPNAATGKRETRTLDKATSAALAASEAQFGRRWMGGGEPEGSDLDSAGKVDTLLAYAAHDLGDVHTERRERIPFFPWIELHDLIRINPDGVRFSGAMDFAVVGVSHEVTAEGAHTVLELRAGSPIGQYFAWHTRPQVAPSAAAFGFINIREVPATRPNHFRLEFETGSRVDGGVWLVYVHVTDPPTADDWNRIAPEVIRLTPGQASFGGITWYMGENWIEVPRPVTGQKGLLHMEPRYLAGGVPTVYDDGRTKIVHRQEVPPDVRRVVARLEKRVSGTSVDLTATIECSAGAGTVVATVTEGTPAGTVLASESFTAPGGTLTPESHSGLADRYAPERASQTWWLLVRDLEGTILAQDHVSAGQVGKPTLTHSVNPDPSSLTGVEVRAEISEPGEMPLTLWVWVNPDGATSADLEAEPSGYAMLSEEIGYTVGPGTDFVLPGGATAKLLDDRPTHPGVQTSVYFEGITVDGRTTGVIRVLLENAAMQFLVDEIGELRVGSVSRGLMLAREFRPYFNAPDLATLMASTPEDLGTDLAYILSGGAAATYEYDEDFGWIDTTDEIPVFSFAPILRAGIVTAEVIAALAIKSKLGGFERLDAGNLNIGSLSLISRDAGTVLDGEFLSPTLDAGMNLGAVYDPIAGTNERFLWHEHFRLYASGDADYDGVVSSSSFRAPVAFFGDTVSDGGEIRIFAPGGGSIVGLAIIGSADGGLITNGINSSIALQDGAVEVRGLLDSPFDGAEFGDDVTAPNFIGRLIGTADLANALAPTATIAGSQVTGEVAEADHADEATGLTEGGWQTFTDGAGNSITAWAK